MRETLLLIYTASIFILFAVDLQERSNSVTETVAVFNYNSQPPNLLPKLRSDHTTRLLYHEY